MFEWFSNVKIALTWNASAQNFFKLVWLVCEKQIMCESRGCKAISTLIQSNGKGFMCSCCQSFQSFYSNVLNAFIKWHLFFLYLGPTELT